MMKGINFESTIYGFFSDAIAWLNVQPVRPIDGKNELEVARKYMEFLKADPVNRTANNAVYTRCGELCGFIEYRIKSDKKGIQSIINNDLFFAVIGVLDAIGKYYQLPYSTQNQETLLKKIKQFKVALNRKNCLKSMLYKMKTPYYFAQKQK